MPFKAIFIFFNSKSQDFITHTNRYQISQNKELLRINELLLLSHG